MTSPPPIDEPPSLELQRLLAHVERLRTSPCSDCGRAICGHEALFDVALGGQDTPRCLDCLARAMGRESRELRDQLAEHLRRRECYGLAWRLESRRETSPSDAHPDCLWPNVACEPPSPAPPVAAVAPIEPARDAPPVALARWDAGDLGCGDLVLRLRLLLREMPPGSVLELVAQDPGAPADLPAWCGLTGHTLVAHRHPTYWIRRKEN